MKRVNEHPKFAAEQQRFDDLLAEQQRLETEWCAVFEQLQRSGGSIAPQPHEDRVRAILSGEPLVERIDVYQESRSREALLRLRRQEVDRLIREQASRVERARERAQAEAFEADERMPKVRAAWDKAERALQEAIAAEDAVIADLIAGGFGWRPATITAPFWLIREDVH